VTERIRYRLLSLISVLLLVIVAAALIKGEGPMAKKVYVVDIKASKPPIFSDQCAVCMQPRQEPVTYLALTATHGRMEYYLYGFTNPYPNEHTLQVPVHASCVKKIRNDFSRRIILIITASILTGVAVYAGRWGGFFGAMLGLLAFGVLLSFTLNAPMPVEYALQRSGEMRFFFRDKAYADNFARRNGGTVREGAYLTEYYPG
jgi:hypothetical protein